MGAELLHAGGRADRHDEADSRFSQFCERAQKINTLNVRLLNSRCADSRQYVPFSFKYHAVTRSERPYSFV